MKKIRILTYFITLSFPLVVFAQQETFTLNLEQAIALAKKQNTAVVNANYDRVIAQKQIWETTAQGLPQVSSSLSYSNNLDLPVTLVPAMMFNPQASPDEFMELKFGVQHNAQFNFQINQLVFNGSYIVGLQTAKIFKQMSEQQYQRTEAEVVKNIKQSFFTLLFSIENLSAMDATLKDIENTWLEMKKTYEQGLTEETTVDQLLLNKLKIENAIQNTQRQIDIQYDMLKIQMGLKIGDSLVISDQLEAAFGNSSFQESIKTQLDISKNPDYQLLSTQEKINYQQMRLEKSKLLPSVNAFFTHSQTGMGDEFDYFTKDQKWFPANIIGASLSIPITTSGGTISRIQQAELEYQKTKNNKVLMEENLKMSAAQARNSLISQYESYMTEKQNLDLAKKIYDRALVKFKQGLLSSTELTQLNTQYYNTQMAYFSAILNVLNAQTELDYILGK